MYVASFAVNLDANGSTWVEPDLTVVCDPGNLPNRGCEGAAADPSPHVYPFDVPVPVGIWDDLAVTVGKFAE